MPINRTERDVQEQAAEDLADKLSLEANFTPLVSEFIKQLADDLQDSVLITGNPPKVEQYSQEIQGLLSNQYKKVSRIFGDKFWEKLRTEPKDSDIWKELLSIAEEQQGSPVTPDEILEALQADTRTRRLEFVNENVRKDTTRINETNAKDLDAAIATAFIALQKELERLPTKKELAERSKETFLKHDLWRAETISATTTQSAAEGSKQITRGTFNDFYATGALPLGEGRGKIEEVWESVGDSDVRIAHLRADGQVKKNGVFVVMGELLRYPGDESLGASLKNVINCRCSAIERFIRRALS